MPTIEERRATALATIEQEKAKGNTHRFSHAHASKALLHALHEMARTDDKAYYAPEPPTPRADQYHHDSSHKATITTPCGGYTVGGSFVPISAPATPEEHDEALGWSDPEDPETVERNQRFTDASDMLSAILLYLSEGRNLHAIGLRAVALVAVINPSLFPDNDGSQASVGRLFGVGRGGVQKYVRQVRKLAHGMFQSPNMLNAERSAQSRERAIAQHRKAGHKMQSEGEA